MNEQPRRSSFNASGNPCASRQPWPPRAPADSLVALCDSLPHGAWRGLGRRVAAEAVAAHEQLTDPGRGGVFRRSSSTTSPADPAKVNLAIDNYRARARRPSRLHLISTSPRSQRRQELFRRLNIAPGGTRTLVRMRADLLRTLDAHPERAAVDADLVHLFRSWFNRGFLVLQRIDWRTSGASSSSA